LRLRFERVRADQGDPAADDRLAADVAGATMVRPGGAMHTYLRVRTAFFDRVVTTAFDQGVRQVVIDAAGYDGRALRYARPGVRQGVAAGAGCGGGALRYARPGVRWFEVDHPATQADKLRRLERLGIASDHVAFVAADFTVDDVAAGLVAAGLDPTVPTLLCC